MTHIERAIKEAVKAGYSFRGDKLLHDNNLGTWSVSDGDGGYIVPADECFFLAPLFWQALGKARGWDDGEVTIEGYSASIYHWMWQFQWHRFIDHLAEGKDAESFFASL